MDPASLSVRVGIDSGGTFTDCVLPDGAVVKVPSTPEDPGDAVRAGLELLGPFRDALLCHGTTVATNQVIQRRGADVALICTEGFADLLDIRRQNRPHIYDLRATWPPPLVPARRRHEVRERMSADGTVAVPIDEEAWKRIERDLLREAPAAVAVALLFSFANPTHEVEVAARIACLLGPAVPISKSYEVFPEPGEYERTSATVLNAYVAPLIETYLRELRAKIGGLGVSRVFVMTSAGGLVDEPVAAGLPLLTLLSGPAAGVVGAHAIAEAAGYPLILTMDVGGTSTDVSVVPGRVLHSRSAMVDGHPIGVDVVDIETVGAGGGSIADVDEAGVLYVGPESAGAVPGPAAYGRGGPFTVTDANVVLGRIGESLLDGGVVLDVEASRAAGRTLAARMGIPLDTLAWSVIRIANSNVERTLARVSLERGYDIREFTLFAFGGAGPQFACEVAEGMGMTQVLIPPTPGVLAAWGLLQSRMVRTYRSSVIAPIDEVHEQTVFRQLEVRARSDLAAYGEPEFERTLEMRYVGQTFTLQLSPGPDLERRFHEAHQSRYGQSQPDAAIQVASGVLRATLPLPAAPARTETTPALSDEPERRFRAVYFRLDQAPTLVGVPIYPRSSLNALEVKGPAILEQYDSTIVVPPGWTATQVKNGCLLITRYSDHAGDNAP